MTLNRYATLSAVTLFSFCFALAQVPPPAAPKLKDEMRMPWKRGGDNFFRFWLSFVRGRSGKVTGFTGYQDGDFEGKKLD